MHIQFHQHPSTSINIHQPISAQSRQQHCRQWSHPMWNERIALWCYTYHTIYIYNLIYRYSQSLTYKNQAVYIILYLYGAKQHGVMVQRMCIIDGLNKMNWSTGIIMLGLLGRLESTQMKPPTGIVPSKNIEKTNSVSKIELNYVSVLASLYIPYGSKQVLRGYSTPQIIPRRLCKSKLQ